MFDVLCFIFSFHTLDKIMHKMSTVSDESPATSTHRAKQQFRSHSRNCTSAVRKNHDIQNFYRYLLSFSLQHLAQLWQLLVSGCLPHSLSLHLIINCKASCVLPGQCHLEAAGLQCKVKGV